MTRKPLDVHFVRSTDPQHLYRPMSPMKRHVFHADELVKVESRQRWYVCTGCYAVIDLGPDPEPHSKAPSIRSATFRSKREPARREEVRR